VPQIIATERPLYHAAVTGNTIHAAGVTRVGELTVSGMELRADADENAFLGKVAGVAGDYQPLPSVGAWLEAGSIYAYAGGLVIVRQSHTRTAHAPADIPALLLVYRENAGDVLEWVAGESVLLGTRRLHNGKLYEALQAHVTQADWQPPNVPALWREVVEVPATPEWAAGIAYKVGDEVTYQGATYRCLQAHTSQAAWTPVAVPSLWQVVN
jgi:hypothetical protein